MTALGWALVALAKVFAPTQIDALQVVASEPALGDEIARAARRYLPRQTQVWSGAAPSPEVSEPVVQLLVQGDPQAARGLRWTIQVSLGQTAKLVRVLELREPPTRFDLAEAVAIELPELLTKLAEDSAAQSALTPAVVKPAPAAPKPTALRPAIAKSEPSSKRTEPEAPTPERQGPAKPSPARSPAQVAAATRPPVPAQAAREAPALAPESPRAEAASPPAQSPPAPMEDKRPQPHVAQSQPTEVLTPPPPPPLQPLPTFAAPVPLRTQRPAGSIGLLASGGALLLTGVGTGIATLVIAQKVSRPPEMKFDRALDQTGKALGTATIVLDAVGASALLVGGIWMYAKSHRTRPVATALSLVPAVSQGQQGLVLQGRWP